MSAPNLPPFARAYPKSEPLEQAVAAFEEGDYAKASEAAKALLGNDDPNVAEAARDLVDRTKPDPSAKLLFALAAILLVGLSLYWMRNDGPDPHAAPPPPPAVEYVK